MSLALGALLGRDDDDTISTARTVERIAGSILEYGDAGHIVGVDAVPQTIIGYTVQYDERVVAGIERTDTANTELGIGIGRTGGREGLQTGHIALQRIHHVVDLSLVERLAVYHACRTRKRRPLLLAVSHNDNLVELLVLRAEDDLHAGGSLHGLRLHTEVFDDNDVTSFHTGQVELAVHIRCGTGLRSLYRNLGTDDRLSILVENLSPHCVGVLCQHLPRRCKQQRGEQYFHSHILSLIFLHHLFFLQ